MSYYVLNKTLGPVPSLLFFWDMRWSIVADVSLYINYLMFFRVIYIYTIHKQLYPILLSRVVQLLGICIQWIRKCHLLLDTRDSLCVPPFCGIYSLLWVSSAAAAKDPWTYNVIPMYNSIFFSLLFSCFYILTLTWLFCYIPFFFVDATNSVVMYIRIVLFKV